MDFTQQTITIMGLGAFPQGSGMAAAKFLAPKCKQLIITDLKTEEELTYQKQELAEFSNITWHLGGHQEADFTEVDMVMRNPDVPAASPYLELARQHNVVIHNDVSLFLSLYGTAQVIGVTGTKGKTTTAHLIHDIVKQQFPDARIGGNMGVSPLTFIDELAPETPVVLELSSFLLHECGAHRLSPHVAVWTNLYEDHLNKYANLDEYIADKQNIIKHQHAEDVAVVNADDVIVNSATVQVPGKRKTFSVAEQEMFAPYIQVSQLIGEHNQANIMAAVLAAQAFGVEEKHIMSGVELFGGVPYRLELVKEVDGIQWYNDSAATTPEAAIAALKTFPKQKTIVITGGNTKGSDLTALRETQTEYAKEVITMPGNATDKLAEGIDVLNLTDAVETAARLAEDGDVVLFSPGLTWLPKQNEFERGDEFTALVSKL